MQQKFAQVPSEQLNDMADRRHCYFLQEVARNTTRRIIQFLDQNVIA